MLYRLEAGRFRVFDAVTRAPTLQGETTREAVSAQKRNREPRVYSTIFVDIEPPVQADLHADLWGRYLVVNVTDRREDDSHALFRRWLPAPLANRLAPLAAAEPRFRSAARLLRRADGAELWNGTFEEPFIFGRDGSQFATWSPADRLIRVYRFPLCWAWAEAAAWGGVLLAGFGAVAGLGWGALALGRRLRRRAIPSVE